MGKNVWKDLKKNKEKGIEETTNQKEYLEKVALKRKRIKKKCLLIFLCVLVLVGLGFGTKKVVDIFTGEAEVKKCQKILNDKLMPAMKKAFTNDLVSYKMYDFKINGGNDFVFYTQGFYDDGNNTGKYVSTFEVANQQYQKLSDAKQNSSKREYLNVLADTFETMELKETEVLDWWNNYGNGDLDKKEFFCKNISDEQNKVQAVIFSKVNDAGLEIIDGVEYCKATFYCKAVVEGTGTVKINYDNKMGNLFGENKEYKNADLKDMVVTLYAEPSLNKDENGEFINKNQRYCVSTFCVKEYYDNTRTLLKIKEIKDVNEIEEYVVERFTKTFEYEREK